VNFQEIATSGWHACVLAKPFHWLSAARQQVSR